MKNHYLPDYQFFGSKNSIDIDVVFFVNKIPEIINDNANLIKNLSTQLKEEKSISGLVNGNLAVVQEGVLIDVFKGTTDELNNALFYTFELHEQDFSNKIKNVLERDIDLKFLRCARMILSFFTKSKQRLAIKEALRGDIYLKFKVLKELNLFELILIDDVELKKTLAFQIGQTLALNQGFEFYSKDEIGNHFKDLSAYLKRESAVEIGCLNNSLCNFLKELENRISTMTHLSEYKYRQM